jgi:predicted lactoylglutathione lyase
MTNTNLSRFRRRAITTAAIVAVLAGGAGVANAAIGTAATDSASSTATALVEQTDTTTPSTDDSATEDSTTNTPDDEADRPARTEETLTGDVADKVTAAALEAVPGGTIERVETDDDGAAYEAHMTDADGNPVTVTFDDSFAVVEIQEGGPGGGRGGHGGDRGGHGGGRGGHGGGEGEEALTGDVATQVTAAAEAAVPGGTIERVETDADGAAYEAHMTDADGNRVTVTFDDSFAVVEIQEGH